MHFALGAIALAMIQMVLSATGASGLLEVDLIECMDDPDYNSFTPADGVGPCTADMPLCSALPMVAQSCPVRSLF